MKKAIAALILLAGLALAGLAAFRAVDRDREYQRLIVRGDDALRRGQTLVALEAFSGAIALKKDSMLAYLKRGEARDRHGDENLTAALRDLRAAAELDPAAARVQEELGDVNFRLHRYANASESYEAYVRLDDRSAQVFYKLALAARAEGRLTRALSALGDALRLDPTLSEARYVQGLCLKDRGQLRDAQRAFEQAVALAPALIPAREELADLDRMRAQGRREIEQLEALAALDPSRAERRTAVGLAYARAGSPELAVTTLVRATEQFHEDPAVYGALGQVWLQTAEEGGDTSALGKALEALEHAAGLPTATSEVLGAYGRALALDGQHDAAERAFTLASERFPTDPTVLPQLAIVAQRLGHLEPARRALVRYALLTDDDREGALNAARIGDLSLLLNDPPSAVAWYERSTALAVPDAGLLARLADAQMRAGRGEIAQETLARAAAKDESDPLVRAMTLRIQHVAKPVPKKIEAED
jgi:tetratricopeptide (TPR) repeat protein